VRVTAALLARYAETEPDGGLLNVIGGGTDVFGVPELSVDFSMPFGLQLRFAEADAGTTFQVGMVVRGPDPTQLAARATDRVRDHPAARGTITLPAGRAADGPENEKCPLLRAFRESRRGDSNPRPLHYE
jgi:hypothetical protein